MTRLTEQLGLAFAFLALNLACGTDRATDPSQQDSSERGVAGLPSIEATPATPTLLAVGREHALARYDGQLYVWGRNQAYQLGTNSQQASYSPIPVQAAIPGPIRGMAAGDATSFVIDANQELWAWGMNKHGESGLGSNVIPGDYVKYPWRMILGVSGVLKVVAGPTFAFALSAGKVYAWGYAPRGVELGHLGDRDPMPYQITGLPSGIVDIAAGEAHGVAVTSAGAVWTWGANDSGQLGDSTTASRAQPKVVPGLTGVTKVSAGWDYTVALRGSDHAVFTWGGNGLYELGYDTLRDCSMGYTRCLKVPQQVRGFLANAISAGGTHMLAIQTDGTLFSWGSDIAGELGIGEGSTGLEQRDPVQPQLSGVMALVVAGSSNSSFSVRSSDQSLWGWGSNDFGQLATGDRDDRLVPRQIAFPAGPDTTVPFSPTTLRAVTASPSEIDLSWNASADNVGGLGVYGYRISRAASAAGPFTQIAEVTATSYSNTGLSASTIYYYRVSALDNAYPRNVSSPAAVSATTLSSPDTLLPTVPTGLSAVAASSSQINLTWAASTDAGTGVYGYRVYVSPFSGTGFTKLADVTSTSYSHTGLAPSKTFYYKVSALDNAQPTRNESSPTAEVPGTTPAAPVDSTLPTVPTGLTATGISGTQINLSWNASTDTGSGIKAYRVYRASAVGGPYTQILEWPSTWFANTGLTFSTTYYYKVSAVDNALNDSGQSLAVPATTKAPPPADTLAPDAPTSLTAAAGSSTLINLSWIVPADRGAGVTGFRIYKSTSAGGPFTFLKDVTGVSTTTDAVSPATTFYYKVAALDAAPNESGQSAVASATSWAGSDTTPPTVPTGFSARGVSTSEIHLRWLPSSDTESGVSFYRVYESEASGGPFYLKDQVYSNFLAITGLTSGTTYWYQVSAVDKANNEGPLTSILSAAALVAPDTTPPSAVTGVTVTVVSSTRIDLTWNASADVGAGIYGYRVYWFSSQLGHYALLAEVTSTSYSITGLPPSVAFFFKVSALDDSVPDKHESVPSPPPSSSGNQKTERD